MARQTPTPGVSMYLPPTNPFLRLPTEIIQHIAYLLPKDSDIAHLSSTCKLLAVKIIPAQSSIWKQKFKDTYDLPFGRNSFELKVEYQIRFVVLRHNISFKEGEHEREHLWLTVVRDMILETYHLLDPNKDGSSRSLQRIREALRGSEFLDRPVIGYGLTEYVEPSDLFCAVQLSLTGLALNLDISVSCLRTDYDIERIYSYEPRLDEDNLLYLPRSVLGKMSLQKLMHIRNFWLRHILNPIEATFHASYAKLAPDHRPGVQGHLTKIETALGTQWLGYYSCIHPYPESWSALHKRQSCADLDDHLTQVDCMSLILKTDNNPVNWPSVFQQLISLGKGPDRIYFRGVQRYHNSDNEETNLLRGFIEPSQDADGGFPAWQRICFAIYEANRDELPFLEDDDGPSNGDIDWLPREVWPPVDLESDFFCIHGYDGRLLPGGRVIMGQWVDMLNTTGRGPFIFWDI